LLGFLPWVERESATFAATTHFLGLLIGVTEQDLGHYTEILVAMTRRGFCGYVFVTLKCWLSCYGLRPLDRLNMLIYFEFEVSTPYEGRSLRVARFSLLQHTKMGK
jgi:hypothetical protein